MLLLQFVKILIFVPKLFDVVFQVIFLQLPLFTDQQSSLFTFIAAFLFGQRTRQVPRVR